MEEYSTGVIEEFDFFCNVLSLVTSSYLKTYILLHSTLLNALEEGFRHSYTCYPRVQPSHKDRLDQILLCRVDTIFRKFHLTGTDKSNLIQGRQEIMSQGRDVAYGRCADEVLYISYHS